MSYQLPVQKSHCSWKKPSRDYSEQRSELLLLGIQWFLLGFAFFVCVCVLFQNRINLLMVARLHIFLFTGQYSVITLHGKLTFSIKSHKSLSKEGIFLSLTNCIKEVDHLVAVIDFMRAFRTFCKKPIFLNCHQGEFC